MRYHIVLLKIHNALYSNDSNALESLYSHYSLSSIFLWCFIIENKKEEIQFVQESMALNVKKLKRSRKERNCAGLWAIVKKNQREWMFSRVSLDACKMSESSEQAASPGTYRAWLAWLQFIRRPCAGTASFLSYPQAKYIVPENKSAVAIKVYIVYLLSLSDYRTL